MAARQGAQHLLRLAAAASRSLSSSSAQPATVATSLSGSMPVMLPRLGAMPMQHGSARAMSSAQGAAAAQTASSMPPPPPPKNPSTFVRTLILGSVAAGGVFAYALFTSGDKLPQQGSLTTSPAKPEVKDYGAVRKALEGIMDNDMHDDGSYGPLLVRLAWHASGTYCKVSKTGGSDGATMRFEPECAHGANAGLKKAQELLEPIKKKFPWISYGDLWTLGGVVAIEYMGGPVIPWRPGRIDKADGSFCPPDGRLPDAAQGHVHVREIFGRMGFDDRETVALIGAHTLGRCHVDNSGYTNAWTNAPTTFSNLYFQELLNNKWTKKKWSGPLQYEDPTGKLMMLPADMCLVWDKKFKKIVTEYAKDEELFFKDFAAAFAKLLELGVKFEVQAAEGL